MSKPTFIVITLICGCILIYSFAYIKGNDKLGKFVLDMGVFIGWIISLIFYLYPLPVETNLKESNVETTAESSSAEPSSSELIIEETKPKQAETEITKAETTEVETSPEPSTQDQTSMEPNTTSVDKYPNLESSKQWLSNNSSSTLSSPPPAEQPSTEYEILSGWVQDGYGNWKWRQDDGMYYERGWINYNGKRYYIDNEIMVTGWYEIENKKYYFNNEGVMQKNIWIDNHFLNSSGYAYIDVEIEIEGKKYHFDINGDAMEIKEEPTTSFNIVGDSIEIEDNYPNNNNDLSNNDERSELSFSNDVGIRIESNGKNVFNLTGSVSSGYGIKKVAYDYYTPESHWPYGERSYPETGPNTFYLADINTTINVNAFNFGDNYIGDYKLIITVEDGSGKVISKELNWQY